MKKVSKLFLMGILGVLCFPIITNAATIKFGTATDDNKGTLIAPIYLELTEEDEAVDRVQFDCSTNENQDLKCEIQKVEGQTANTGNVYINAIVDEENRNSNFKVGEKIHIADIKVRNQESYKIKGENVDITLENIKLGNASGSFEYTGEKPTLSKSISAYIDESAIKVSSDATLKNMKVTPGTLSPNFSKDVDTYTVFGINDTVNRIAFEPECNEGNCVGEVISGGEGVTSTGLKVSLNKGENTIKFQVTAEDGKTKKVYTFKVYRGAEYNSSKLSSLSFGDYVLTPTFNKDTLKYTMTVPANVNSVDAIMEYVLVDENAKVEKSGTDNLKTGDNILKLSVTNISGDETTEYVVTIKRQSDENIEILSYKDGNVVFYDSEGMKTTLSEKEFEVTYPKEYEKITSGEYKFDEEGNLKIETDEPVEEEPAEEKEGEKSSKTWLIVLLIVLGLAVIGISGFFIFRKKKTPEEPVESDDTEEIGDVDETGVEEQLMEEETELDQTVDIDEALSDLLSTKQYEFDDFKTKE